jgi:hypothetical protein
MSGRLRPLDYLQRGVALALAGTAVYGMVLIVAYVAACLRWVGRALADVTRLGQSVQGHGGPHPRGQRAVTGRGCARQRFASSHRRCPRPCPYYRCCCCIFHVDAHHTCAQARASGSGSGSGACAYACGCVP